MKSYIETKLAKMSRKLLKRQKPFVVGVTGSVGKSSTKQAIGAVLGGGFRVRVSPKNYNTEFGLPFAVLGLEMPKSSAQWLGALWTGCMRSNFGVKDYPDTLVLEMAADRPRDIAKLVGIAPPKIGVVTTVGESHAEAFGSAAAIAKEKGTLVEAVAADGVAVLNRDDELVWEMRNRTKAKVMSYGFHEQADVRALEETVSLTCRLDEGCGTHFKIAANGHTVPVFVPHGLGKPTVYAALAAAAVGMARGMNLVEVAERLREFDPPPGRLRHLEGIKRTTLIDDSYNAAPKSAIAALEVLRALPLAAADDKRFAVFGDMLELGAVSEDGHRMVGRRAAELGIDYLVLVGERVGDMERGAREAGMTEAQVFHFGSTDDAGRFVQERMKQGDAVLVKGSRGMQMERVTKELMADPLHAADLLPGEHEEWRL